MSENRLKTVKAGGPPPFEGFDIDVSELEYYPNALVAAFDFLGFKHMMQTADDLWRLGAHTKMVLDLIRATGEANTAFSFEGDTSTSVPFIMNVSDTIISVGPSNRPADILQFLWNAHQLMFYSLQAGMPLRGALCTGEILISRERRLFMGPAVLEALSLERLQEWSGACLSSGLVKHLDSTGLSSQLFPLVVPYPVPWKAGVMNHGVNYALNWIADSMSFIAPDHLPTKFPKGRPSDDSSVDQKILNTQAFLREIVVLRQTHPPFKWPHNRHLVLEPGKPVRVTLDASPTETLVTPLGNGSGLPGDDMDALP